MSAGTPTIPQGILPSQDQSEPYLNRLAKLTKYEFDYILEAVRRDLRQETDKMHSDPQWSFYHGLNAHHAIKVLEVLNPKHIGANPCLIKKTVP